MNLPIPQIRTKSQVDRRLAESVATEMKQAVEYINKVLDSCRELPARLELKHLGPVQLHNEMLRRLRESGYDVRTDEEAVWKIS